MQNNYHLNQNIPPIEEESSIDIKKWLIKIISNWYFFAVSIIAFGIGCYYLNRTIDPLFKSNSTVLIEEFKQRSMMGAQSVMQDFGVGAYRNVNNQIVLMSSYSMIKRAVEVLPLDVDYHFEEKFREYPYYKNSPINATFINRNIIPYGLTFSVKNTTNDKCILNIKGNETFDNLNSEISYGDTVLLAGFSVIINKSDFFYDDMPVVYFRYRSKESLISEFSSRMSIDFVMDQATIVEVALTSPNPSRDVDFLNTLIQEFLNDNLERKNREAIRTIDFITTQLLGVADSLAISENSLQSYRSENNVIDISSQTNLLIQKANQLETNKSALLIKRDYYQYLKDYLAKNTDDAVVTPSTIGIDDAMLGAYIKQYTDIQFEKQMLAPKAPYQSVLTAKLEKTREALIESTQSAIENTNLSIADINNQLEQVQRLSEELPSKERQLLGIQRQLTVNDTYYTYLLQKRSEAQIQQASNSPDNMLIDKARTLGRTNRKKTRLNYIIALMLGGGLPLLWLILADVFNTKIKTKADIESITDLPILGSIAHKLSDSKIPTIDNPRSTFTESFRALRTRLNFMQGDNPALSIMVTSALSGEGKTFVAINLAGIFAISGKKTLLLGYDLRKPKIAEYLEEKQKHGLSNYFIGQDSLDDIIIPYRNNLDIIYSGTIPPNPGELSADIEKNEALFTELKKRYDYIIVDSTPVGAVADAFLIGQYVDTVLFIAKHNYTHKDILEECLKQLKHNNINSVGIVANDVSIKQSTYRYGRYVYGKRYGYGYGNGYGYGYGSSYGGGYGDSENGYTED